MNKLPIVELNPAAIPVIITAFGTFSTSSGVKNLYSYIPLYIVSVACWLSGLIIYVIDNKNIRVDNPKNANNIPVTFPSVWL